jgi:hypothetical protein
MSKRILVALGFLGVLAGLAYAVRPMQAQAKALCAFPNKAIFSPGAVAEFNGQAYRCVMQFDDDLKPTTLGWIKLSKPDFTPEAGIR